MSMPTPATHPRDALLWVRRAEILTGLLALAGGIALWDAGWGHWLLIGAGLLGLSPWPGARAVLRRAERRPEPLVTDATRRRARGRRAALVQIPAYVVVGLVLGLVVDGWPAAIVMASLMGASAILGAWLFLRRAAA